MNCSPQDLKAYSLGEIAPLEKASLEEHVRACQNCREELDRLNLTRTALMSLEDEEVPRRISFVSDKVFEPRWYETIWRSGPAMGLASAALLAAAIFVHAFARPIGSPPATPTIDTAQIEQRIEREVNARMDAAVGKAVSDAQARQSDEFSKVLAATTKRFEDQRKADLATVQQAAQYYEKQMGRWQIAFNGARAGE